MSRDRNRNVVLALFAVVLVFAGLHAATLLGLWDNVHGACIDRKHQYDALHDVIVKSYAPQTPPEAILELFPQIRAIYTPGTPQYVAAQKAQADRRDDVLAILGDRPSC